MNDFVVVNRKLITFFSGSLSDCRLYVRCFPDIDLRIFRKSDRFYLMLL